MIRKTKKMALLTCAVIAMSVGGAGNGVAFADNAQGAKLAVVSGAAAMPLSFCSSPAIQSGAYLTDACSKAATLASAIEFSLPQISCTTSACAKVLDEVHRIANYGSLCAKVDSASQYAYDQTCGAVNYDLLQAADTLAQLEALPGLVSQDPTLQLSRLASAMQQTATAWEGLAADSLLGCVDAAAASVSGGPDNANDWLACGPVAYGVTSGAKFLAGTITGCTSQESSACQDNLDYLMSVMHNAQDCITLSRSLSLTKVGEIQAQCAPLPSPSAPDIEMVNPTGSSAEDAVAATRLFLTPDIESCWLCGFSDTFGFEGGASGVPFVAWSSTSQGVTTHCVPETPGTGFAIKLTIRHQFFTNIENLHFTGWYSNGLPIECTQTQNGKVIRSYYDSFQLTPNFHIFVLGASLTISFPPSGNPATQTDSNDTSGTFTVASFHQVNWSTEALLAVYASVCSNPDFEYRNQPGQQLNTCDRQPVY